MEDSQEKDCSFLFPNLYDALVCEREFKNKFTSDHLRVNFPIQTKRFSQESSLFLKGLYIWFASYCT